MSQHNTIVWADIPVAKLKRACKFYSAVLGAPVKLEAAHGFKYGLLPHAKNNVSGCLCVLDGVKPSKNGTMIYLNVDGRHDAAEKAAGKTGGKILKQKHAIGPYGFRTVLVDSEGNRIALHSSKG